MLGVGYLIFEHLYILRRYSRTLICMSNKFLGLIRNPFPQQNGEQVKNDTRGKLDLAFNNVKPKDWDFVLD